MLITEKKPQVRLKVLEKGGDIFAAPRCDNAVRFCQIANRDYLFTSDIAYIQRLGFDIVEVNN